MEDFIKFKTFIDDLLENDDSKVEYYLDEKILDVQQRSVDLNVAQQYLEMYAELCGDVDSLSRFDRLFDVFKHQLLVVEEQRLRFIQSSPVNRWF